MFLARRDDFVEALRSVGIQLPNAEKIESPLTLVRAVSRFAEDYSAQSPDKTVFSDIAVLSLRQTLSRALTRYTPSMFGTTYEDVRDACRRYATVKRFGTLARDFFGILLE